MWNEALRTKDVFLAIAAGKMFPMHKDLRRAGADLSISLAAQGERRLNRAALAIGLQHDPFSLDLLLNYTKASLEEGAPVAAKRALESALLLNPNLFLIDPDSILRGDLRRTTNEASGQDPRRIGEVK